MDDHYAPGPAMTAARAKTIMLDWAEGRLSHTNIMMDMERGPEDRVATLAATYAADAAEAMKWAAIYQALAVGEAALVVKARQRVMGTLEV